MKQNELGIDFVIVKYIIHLELVETEVDFETRRRSHEPNLKVMTLYWSPNGPIP